MDRCGGSKLLQMQARFQQKQMEERELKIASLYEAQQERALTRVRHSPSGTTASSPQTLPVHQPGKVRQMFEERRTKAGIDKSYPLQPIHNTERVAPRKPLPNGYNKVTTKAKVSDKTVSTKTRTVNSKSVTSTHIKKEIKIENRTNGSGDLNHNHETDLNSLSKNNDEIKQKLYDLDKVDSNYMLENETFPEAMAPTPTPRSPEPVEPKRPPRRNAVTKASPEKMSPKPEPAPVPSPRKNATERTVREGSQPLSGAMQRSANPVPKKQPLSTSSTKARGRTASTPSNGGSNDDGAACAVCGRRFAPERLAKHQDICRAAATKKRKPFDALKHRLAGTEAEPFINKLRKSKTNPVNTSATKVNKSLNNNWRKKHEEFIQAIRAAKQVQAHLNAGGKLSDLPPPPPSENPDYVPCPHCGRRFNQAAAERHIPKCANFQFNKPKPNAKRR